MNGCTENKYSQYRSYGYKNHYTNTDSRNVCVYLAASKFSGVNIRVFDKAYSRSNHIIPRASAIVFMCEPKRRNRRLFEQYFYEFFRLRNGFK